MPPLTGALIEAGLRGGFVTLMLLLAWRLLRGPRGAAAGLAVMMCVGSAAFAVQSTQAARVAAGLMPAWQWPLQALMNGNPVVTWLLARALFDDGFRLRPWHGGLWLAWVSLSLGNCGLWQRADLALLTASGPLLFALASLWPLLRSWRGDLVELRIRWRVRILAMVLGYSVLSAAAGIPSPAASASAWMGLVDAAVLWVVGAAVACTLLDLRASLWTLIAPAPAPVPAALGPGPTQQAEGVPAPPPPAASPAVGAAGDGTGEADPGALARLQRAMVEEQVFRREGITIGALAAHLGLPEYRLRRVINGQLGQRNFNAYMNAHRIAWARAALADPARSAVPVLSLAVEAGFQSLGPFNRAFKAETGLTPTEYRARALAGSR